MNKNYRGPAESKELSEDGPAIDQADKGSAKKGHHKKGGAKYKKGAGDYDVKKGSHGHPHGAAQELSARDKILQYGKDVATEKARKKGKELVERNNSFLLDSINLEKQGEGTKARQMYGTNYGQIGKDSQGQNKYLGSMTSKEVAGSDKMTDEYFDQVLKNYKDSEFYPGAGRMGYTQNFGPARGNSYARGAAKVASIMNLGAAKGKGAAEYGGKKGDDSKSKKDYEG